MDAEHRHELKENDLAEFLANIGPWWSAHWRTVFTVVLVVAVVVGWWRWNRAQTLRQHEDAWGDLAFATSPESYRGVANTYDDPTVQALANLRGADLLLASAANPTPPPEPSENDPDPPPAIPPDEALEAAAAMYQQVANQTSVHLVYKLNASLGLAAVAEGQRNWDAARGHYQHAIEQAGSTYPSIADQAQARLGMLDRLAHPIVFGPEPPPTTTQPANTDAPQPEPATDPPGQP